jgi:4a-hydroxytetrahydrobiopterin dehydratase
MTHSCDLAARRCAPCEGGVPTLDDETTGRLLAELDGWTQADRKIAKAFRFTDHYQLMAFVNAVAWISHREDHHPEITLGYADCRVSYSTHAIGGLSENDFICAAKVDLLFAQQPLG